MQLKETDIHWAAGYLEGEACFTLGRSLGIDVSSTDINPLRKLQKLFGGRLVIRPLQHNCKLTYRWWLGRSQGLIPILNKILPLMSPRRAKRIKQILKISNSRKIYIYT